jgi:broad specificity phosphatase PhoE
MAHLILYLLRHGESVANLGRVFAGWAIDPSLSAIGIQQVQRQAEFLKTIEFSAIYSSPLLRARQTAEIVGKQCGVEPLFSDCLREVNVGVLDGKNQDDPQNWSLYEKIIQKWEQGDNNVGFPDGETLNDIETRLRGFLDSVEQKGQERVLIIGHCLLFMVAIWLFCENRGSTMEDGHMGRGCLSIIVKSGDRYRMEEFNIVPERSVQTLSGMGM